LLYKSENVYKAYGEGPRSKQIRAYIYKKGACKWPGGFGKDNEVDFNYTAKVLCIFRDGIRLPNTTSDLINLGTAKQMLVAMQFRGIESGKSYVPGRDGAENRRWAALSVHNSLQLGRGPIDDQKSSKGEHKAGPEQLPLILKAMGLMSQELNPPVIDPEEPPPKPTGEKIAEILGKTKKMETAFDQIIDRLIDDILWGSDADWTCGKSLSVPLASGDCCNTLNPSSALACSFCKVLPRARARALSLSLPLSLYEAKYRRKLLKRFVRLAPLIRRAVLLLYESYAFRIHLELHKDAVSVSVSVSVCVYMYIYV
jgi:hypothetical protein